MVLFPSFYLLFSSFKYIPKASMDGTHIPMKMAAFSSPLKYNISEKISERKAATNNNLSVVVNFLSIPLLVFYFVESNLTIYNNTKAWYLFIPSLFL